jgi:MFS family permease
MAEAPPASPPTRDVNWPRRILVGLVVLAVVLLVGWIGAAFVPRWWSHRIGDQVDGSITAGIGLGLFYGFVFTVLPLLLLWWAFRRRRGWKTWAVAAGAAILLAAPNLLTLGIVVGRGNAAHAGDRTLDVDAPGFRGASLTGAVVAVVAVVLLGWLLGSRRHAHRRADRLEEELRAEKRKAVEPGPSPVSDDNDSAAH